MATTPGGTYYADSTEQLSDYPALSENLALQIESRLALKLNIADASGGGLALVAVSAFTAVSSLSINSCFSADYDDYRVLVDFSAAVGANQMLTARLRLSGTDSSTGYRSQWHQFFGAGSASGGEDRTGTDDWFIGSVDATYPAYSSLGFDLHNPALARASSFRGQYHYNDSANAKYPGFVSGHHTVATAYDGLTIGTNGTSMTGKIRVYGYLPA